MDSASVDQMIASLLVEGIKVGDVLEVVGVKLAVLQGFVRSDIVGEFDNLQVDVLLGEVVDDQVQQGGMRLRGGADLQRDRSLCLRGALLFLRTVGKNGGNRQQDSKSSNQSLFHNQISPHQIGGW